MAAKSVVVRAVWKVVMKEVILVACLVYLKAVYLAAK